MKITSIIVAYNEEKLVPSIVGELKKQEYEDAHEIILTDGGSSDNTVSLAKNAGIQVVMGKKGKALQMNEAAKTATGDILFFIHADMELQSKTLTHIRQHILEGYEAGGFSNVFTEHNQKIKALGTWMNFRFFDKREQSDRGIFYGDNGIFVKREVFEKLGGFANIPIMEDYDLSLRLKKNGYRTIKIETPKIHVSPRRHTKAGFFKTRFQWVMIRKLYKIGVSPNWLAKWYGDVR
jgi:rSAM/selenodomain-associated transferase 2